MKMRKSLVVLVCIMVLLAGCGSAKNSSDESMESKDTSASDSASYSFGEADLDDYTNGLTYDDSESEEESTDSGLEQDSETVIEEEDLAAAESAVDDTTDTTSTDTDSSAYERKLIRTADVELETEKFNRVKNDVDLLVEQKDGYIGNAYLENEGDSRYYSIEARIPQENLDAFLDEITQIGTVTVRSMQESSEDITLNYYDTSEAKKSLMEERTRIAAMIDDADSLEYIIKLEDKLSELNQQIASYERKIRNYDNKVDYSTVNLSIYEIIEPEEEVELSVGQKMGKGFLNSVTQIKNFLIHLAITIVVISPYLVILVVLVGVLWIVLRRKSHQSMIKKNKEKIDKK